MTGCPPCDAARELVQAGDQLTTAARAKVVRRTDRDRHKAAEQAWDTARQLPHTCYRSPRRSAAA